MHGVRKNAHEIEVHGVEEALLVHDESELFQLNLSSCGTIGSNDSIEGTSDVNMTWVLNCLKDVSQLCDILKGEIDDVLITNEFEGKMWRIQVITGIHFLKVND
jgi:hypothetical protein